MTTEHPFAPYVRTLGKGKQGSRSLTLAEARAAMAMILAGEARPEQLGAFLMLLRVKEESPEEIAGFVMAAREAMDEVEKVPVDLDWACYAGKKRQPPWFMLVVRLLVDRGVRVVMHGSRGHTPGRVYAEDLLEPLGLGKADSLAEAARLAETRGFAYLPLEAFSPRLQEIIELRPLLGLRSPVHTLCRLLNPLDAPARVDGVFHPAYGPIHQQSARLLGHRAAVTIKGDGGEAEIRPDADSVLQWVLDDDYEEEIWPRVLDQRQPRPVQPDPGALVRLWREEKADPYGEAAVKETLAVVLRLLGRATSVQEARTLACEWWSARERRAL